MHKDLYIWLLFILCLVAPVSHSATVYKCEGEGEGGSTLFSESPCKNQKGQKLYYQENYPVGEGLSDLELQQLQEIEAKERQMGLEKNQAAQQNTQTQKTLVNEINKQDCEAADMTVKEWQKIMSLGYPDEVSNYYQDELRKRNAIKYEKCGYQ